MTEREPIFLEKYTRYEKNYLTSDLSPRKYFRWRLGKDTLVLMDCPDLNSMKAFVDVGQYLISQNLSAPQILEADHDNGFLLIEDFGDATFTSVLGASTKREHEIYGAAVDVLIHLQERTSDQPVFLKEYTVEFGLIRVQRFLTYYPQIDGHGIDQSAQDQFMDVWKKALSIAAQAKKNISLRDYHVDNLMDLHDRPAPKNIGLLDFQDAIWAPRAMDLLSLIEDARRDVSDELANLMWKKFLDAYPKGDHEEIVISGLIHSAARHLRIIGLFNRVANERGDKRFLSRIPSLWRLFDRCCNKIHELKEVKEWFETNFPQTKMLASA